LKPETKLNIVSSKDRSEDAIRSLWVPWATISPWRMSKHPVGAANLGQAMGDEQGGAPFQIRLIAF
jgi:hypothetical protein